MLDVGEWNVVKSQAAQLRPGRRLGRRMKRRVVAGRDYARIVLWRYRIGSPPVPPPHAYKVDSVRGHARRSGASTFVETGTFKGAMVDAVRSEFDRIWSVELDPSLYQAAVERFRAYPHITLVQGDSATVLGDILDAEPGPILFWLDGHWSGGGTARGSLETPIVAELQSILERDRQDDVILIDDARKFGTGDYPSVASIEAMIAAARPSWSFEVRGDIIRTHRRTW